MKSVFSLALLLPLPGAHLLAQGGSEPCITPVPEVLPWPDEELLPDSAGLDIAIVGDFDGNLTGDAVWVIDGAAVLAIKPAVYEDLTYPVATGGTFLEHVTGLALSPADPGEKDDAFFAANDVGLAQWRFLGLSTSSVPQFSFTTIETSAWVDATHLHHADLDGQGPSDVIGINSAQDRVLVVRHDGTGFSSTQQIAIPLGDIWDVAPVDWLDTGFDCIAVLTSGGLAIIKPTQPTPTLVKIYEVIAEAGVITAMKLPNGKEVIAWARRSSTVAPHLVLRGNGDFSPDPIWLSMQDCGSPTVFTNAMPFSIEACDYDTAAGDELVLGLPGGANDRIAVLINQGSTPYFSTSSSSAYNVVSTTEGYGIPGVGQLDDGPEDIVIPVASGDLEIFVALPYVYKLNGPPTESTVILPVTEWGQLGGEPSETDDRQLNMAFRIPTEYLPWATHLELRLWYSHDPSPTPTGKYVDSLPHFKVYPLSSSGTDQFIVIGEMEDGLAWDPQHHYYTEFRFVNYDDVNEEVLQASRVFSLAYTLCTDAVAGLEEADGDFIEYLVGASYSFGTGFQVLNKCELTHPPGSDTGAVHGFFYPAVRPPLEPGNVPPPPGLVAGAVALPLP